MSNDVIVLHMEVMFAVAEIVKEVEELGHYTVNNSRDMPDSNDSSS